MTPEIAYKLRCHLDVLRHERGAAMVEYSLLIALIALIATAAITLLGDQLSTEFSEISSNVEAN